MAKQLLFNQTPSSGGGMGDGVVLWENPNPDVAFIAQPITLENYLAYEFISVKWRLGTNSDKVAETIFSIQDFNNLTNEDVTNGPAFGAALGNSDAVIRCLIKVSDAFYLGNCVNAYSQLANDYIIPLQIIGY